MPCYDKTKEYDEEPVRFCSKCYSLKIGYEEAIDSECCMECGCSDVSEATIEEWERLFEERYGHKYVKRNNDPKRTLLYSYPIDKLEDMIIASPQWKDVIKELYPHFPGGLRKIEAVVLLFDQLEKDNRMDDLRITMYNHKIY